MNVYVKLLICLTLTTQLSNCLPSHEPQRISHQTHKQQSVADNNKIAEDEAGPRKFRCGYDDVVKHLRHRNKRYALLASKWQNWISGSRNLLLWKFNNSHPQYESKVNEIRENIREATRVWSANSVLSFSEVRGNRDADIVISFQGEYHEEVDPYPINDTTLAHAFPPARGLGGDIHVRSNQVWNFDMNKTTPPRSNSFYAVILHEMGHALGLDHSDNPDAVMFESLHEKTGMLHIDDIEGIEHIYGKSEKNRNLTTTTTPKPQEEELPADRCNTSFDAATRLRGELFLFKDKYLWRPRRNQEAFRIRDIFPELPIEMTHVDAVYETINTTIWFFIGRDIYIFRKNKFESKITLKDIGIDERKYKKIDAIFRWPFNNRTFIFSGDDYWRLDDNFKIDDGYPKEILGTWRDVYDIDTAFTDIDNLYFFKGMNAYKFDSARMRINRMNSTTIGSTFMGCIDIRSRHPDDDRETNDVILNLPEEDIPEDNENIEKVDPSKKREPSSSNSINPDRVYKYFITLVSITSLCFY